MKSHRRFILITLTALLALALSACQSTTPTPAASETAATSAGAVVQSRIEPQSYTDLAFLVAGRVAEVSAAEGDSVTTGQVLARLAGSEQRLADLARAKQEVLSAEQAVSDIEGKADLNKSQAQSTIADARKAVEDAQERLDKLKEDSDSKEVDLDQASAKLDLLKTQLKSAEDQAAELKDGINPDLLASAQARVESARASLASAQSALDSLELRAPADGTIASLNLKVGQFAAAGQSVVTLADFSKWIALTDDLTELEVVKVKSGDSASLTLDALPEDAISGKVVKIATRYVEKRGDTTYQVTIALDQLPADARWGMSGQISFGEGK